MVVQILRVALVIALVCFAAALATPPGGRLPLALRGLQKMLRKDAGVAVPAPQHPVQASPARRFAAFLLVLLAALLALV